jgi:hypothetical protein
MPTPKLDQQGQLERLAQEVRGQFHGSYLGLEMEGGLLEVKVRVRGFVSKAFESEGPAWLRRHHIVRLALEGKTADWSRVGRSPLLPYAHVLSLDWCDVKDTGAAALAGCPELAGLAGLSMSLTHLGHAGASAIAGCKALAGLVALDLSVNSVNREVIRALAEGPLAVGLRNLSLATCHLDFGEAKFLAEQPGLSGLVTLDLSGNRLMDHSLRHLIDSPHLSGVRNLNLHYNWLTDVGAQALAGSGLLGRLRWLGLDMNHRMTSKGRLEVGRAVAEVPGCRLVLSGYDISQDVAERLKDALGPRLTLVG